jgi:hypothetical protein
MFGTGWWIPVNIIGIPIVGGFLFFMLREFFGR